MNEVKYHFMSQITGEICENIWEVLKSIGWWLTHYNHLNNITVSTYIKYVFAWSYSKQGF